MAGDQKPFKTYLVAHALVYLQTPALPCWGFCPATGCEVTALLGDGSAACHVLPAIVVAMSQHDSFNAAVCAFWASNAAHS